MGRVNVKPQGADAKERMAWQMMDTGDGALLVNIIDTLEGHWPQRVNAKLVRWGTSGGKWYAIITVGEEEYRLTSELVKPHRK